MSFPCILGQWGSIHGQRSPRSGKAKTWPRLVTMPGHRSTSWWSQLALEFSDELGDRRTECMTEGALPLAARLRYILSRGDIMAHVLPNNCDRKALPSISYSISSSFPLPRLGTTALEQCGLAGVDFLLGGSVLHPTKVTGRSLSLHKPLTSLVEPLKVRWGQNTDGTPIPFLFKHSVGNFFRFQHQAFGYFLLVCIYACVCM